MSSMRGRQVSKDDTTWWREKCVTIKAPRESSSYCTYMYVLAVRSRSIVFEHVRRHHPRHIVLDPRSKSFDIHRSFTDR